MNLLLGVLLVLAAQEPRAERIKDTDYEKYAARFVRDFEALEKGWKGDPAAAATKAEALIEALEKEFLPRFPKHAEAVLHVWASSGVNRGDVVERHPFHPYRAAGEIALGAGRPERAVELLLKSPDSAPLLASARKAVEEKNRKPDPPPLQKPAGPDIEPFLRARDFAGALLALAPARPQLGKEYDALAARVRDAALDHQKEQLRQVAAALPRALEEDFRKKHLDPCLDSCAKVPPAHESRELAWTRRLAAWTARKDPGELDELALAAFDFDPSFHAVLRLAQETRVSRIEALVQEIAKVSSRENKPLLERLAGEKKAFELLRARRAYADLLEDLAQIEKGLPPDEKALEAARQGAATSAEIVALADRLERAWDSDQRLRLSGPDQNELALWAGVYRTMWLFLEGKSVAEAAQDARVRVFFQTPLALPAGLPPRVAAVRSRLKNP